MAPSAIRFGGQKRQKGIRGTDAACAAVGIADSPMPNARVLHTNKPTSIERSEMRTGEGHAYGDPVNLEV